MEIKINVDESMFSEVLDKELKGLTPEELHDVMIQCIKEYFTVDNYKNLEKLFVKESNNYYGSREYKPTDFTNQLAARCDCSKLQEIVDIGIDTLKNNHEYILQRVLFDLITTGLASTYSFRESISEVVSDILSRRNNP
jgi:hypothetical protein